MPEASVALAGHRAKSRPGPRAELPGAVRDLSSDVVRQLELRSHRTERTWSWAGTWKAALTLLRMELPFLALPDADGSDEAQLCLTRLVEAEQVPAVGDKVFVSWQRGGDPEVRAVVEVLWLFSLQAGQPVAELCLESATGPLLPHDLRLYEAEGWGS